jgi:cyclopropane fatty-acyl-phospholipid synthase-like methyltransferase
MAIERIVPDSPGWEAFYANHICRYYFAQEQIKSCAAIHILDAACGVGYGSNLLAQDNDLNIIAIDRSSEALNIAQKTFSKDNIRFLKDDCHTLNNANKFAPYDCIVSFETLEHLPKPAAFISSCYANLKTGGSLIISTPNQPVSSPGGVINWEFHEKEYTVDELSDILTAAGFKDVVLFGQKYTATGKLRDAFRAELNRLHSNPFSRLGKFIQQTIRKRKFHTTLPEQDEDFEIIKYDPVNDNFANEKTGPFVLIAVCRK